MLEADARTKVCPMMSRGDFVMCQGADCALWVPDNSGPIIVKATDRAQYDNAGWSTNGMISEDGMVTFYKPPAGHCGAGQAPSI